MIERALLRSSRNTINNVPSALRGVAWMIFIILFVSVVVPLVITYYLARIFGWVLTTLINEWSNRKCRTLDL